MLLVIAILCCPCATGTPALSLCPSPTSMLPSGLAYKDTWGAGLHLRTPFVERVSRKVSLKEEAADFLRSPLSTRDNVTMMIDTVVFSSRCLMPSCLLTVSTAPSSYREPFCSHKQDIH